MYTRSYRTDSSEPINIPENYDGVTFSSQNEEISFENEVEVSAPPNKNPWEGPPPPRPHTDADEGGRGLFGGLGKLPFLSGIFGGGSLPFGNLKMPKIGTEEILIIGAALFLFFSKEGDRECALMLLLLLLIS